MHGSRYTGYCPGSSLSVSLSVCSCAVLSLDVTEKHFGLGNVRVGVAHTGGEIIGDVSGHDPGVAPVPGKSNLVYHPPLDKERLEAFGDQRVHLDRAPRAAHDHLVAVLD